MLYIGILIFLLSYYYRFPLIYCLLNIYNKYDYLFKKKLSKKIQIDIVDKNNNYINTKNNLNNINNIKNSNYIIISFNKKKIIFEERLDIQKCLNYPNIKNKLICINTSIIKDNVTLDEYNFIDELSEFFIYECYLDLYKLKDLWLSIINKKYNTNYNSSECNINWTIITDKVKVFNGEKIIIEIRDGFMDISNK